MGKIKGITITLIDKIQSGKDPFGNPIYSEVEKRIDNVLVAPTSADDITNNLEKIFINYFGCTIQNYFCFFY